MVFQVFSILSLITETVRRHCDCVCVWWLNVRLLTIQPLHPLHPALRRILYNIGSSINKLALILVLLHTWNTIHAIYLFFLGCLVPPCCLDSGSVDVAFCFQEERWHRASVSLPCENDDGNNRAATCTLVALSSFITTAFHWRHPSFLCFPTCCTMTTSPGFM